jgi:hypothetical protein
MPALFLAQEPLAYARGSESEPRPEGSERALIRAPTVFLSRDRQGADAQLFMTPCLDIGSWSLPLDWFILLRTIPRVVTGQGAY